MHAAYRFFLLCLSFALVGLSPGGLGAAPGDVDATFDPNANGIIYGVAAQPDGKVIVGGVFTSLQPNGATAPTTRNHVARLFSDGSLDANFDPNANDTVHCLAVQGDGKVIVGGEFTSLQPNGAAAARNHLARLNADGSLDATFNPNVNDTVYGLAVQADGKILIGGRFTSLQPNGAVAGATRNRIARLNPDGSLDATFNPGASSFVYSVAVQADGKIVIGGNFGVVAGQLRAYVARLNVDGSLDSLSIDPSDRVYSVTVQADGKILFAGDFTAVRSGAVRRNHIARLTADGLLDDFDPSINGGVQSVAGQADGKILVLGNFTSVQSTTGFSATRNRLLRLNGDGSLDTAFDPNANDDVYGAAAQADGKLLVVGAFGALQPNGAASATARYRVARLALDPIFQKILVTGSTSSATVRLLRGGALPETQQVTFEVSSDGAVWRSLTSASRSAGGWQVTGYDLGASSGFIRARVRTSSGRFGGSSGLLQLIAPFPTPDLNVDQPADTELLSNASKVDFGEFALGTTPSKLFTLRNSGQGTLRISSFAVVGPDADDFVVDTSNTLLTLLSGSATQFSVRLSYAGATSGVHNATLRIASNANGTSSPFDVALTGLGLSPTGSTGNDGLNDHSKYTLRALGFDWQQSQSALVQALYGGATTAGLYTTAQVQALNVGVPLIQKDAGTGQFKLTIAVQQSVNLKTYSPLSLSTGTTAINSDGALEFRFYAPGATQFYRLQSQ